MNFGRDRCEPASREPTWQSDCELGGVLAAEELPDLEQAPGPCEALQVVVQDPDAAWRIHSAEEDQFKTRIIRI